MNRFQAADQLAVWRRIVDDTEGPTVQRAAVAGLVRVCEWYAAEVERLEQISRADVVHLAQLAKANRDLLEMIPPHRLVVEHVESDPAGPLVRPPATDAPLEPVELPRRVG